MSWLSTFLKPPDQYKIDRSKVLRLVADDMRAAGYKFGALGENGEMMITDSAGNAPRKEDNSAVLKNDELIAKFESEYIAQSNAQTQTTTTTSVDTGNKKPLVQERENRRVAAAMETLKRAGGE